jgi:hypothetical protein
MKRREHTIWTLALLFALVLVVGAVSAAMGPDPAMVDRSSEAW